MKTYDRGGYGELLSDFTPAPYVPPSGYVRVGDRLYANPWVPVGKIIWQVSCLLCLDTGFVTDDDGEPTEEACDCWRGWTW